MMTSARSFLLLTALGLALASVGAQAIVTDEDALFGEPEPATTAPAAGTDTAPAEATAPASAGIEQVAQGSSAEAVNTFLKPEATRIGGSFTGTVKGSFTWYDPWSDPAWVGPDSQDLVPTVSATVFFDGRPNEETRFYGSLKTSWPFADTIDYLASDSTPSMLTLPNIQVFELFADRSWNDLLYFRFGKHTVKWGVGYFWSPADVINLTAIDVTDPSAQREGPISLRLNVPIPNTQQNIWLYGILPELDDPADLEPADIAVAGKYEFLLGGFELGLGAFYQRDRAPKGMLTATGAIWKFNLFGEAVVGWGSDRQWVDTVLNKDDTLVPVMREASEGLFFSGSIGFTYMESKQHFSATVQYFYNGEGYADADKDQLVVDANALIGAISQDTTLSSDDKAQKLASANLAVRALINQSGCHYLGIQIIKTELFVEDLSANLLVIANLSDLSGMVMPAVSYSFFDGFSLAFTPTFYWGIDGLWGDGEYGEYVIMAGGPAMSLSITATLGSGRF